jgi:hypothetical protein
MNVLYITETLLPTTQNNYLICYQLFRSLNYLGPPFIENNKINIKNKIPKVMSKMLDFYQFDLILCMFRYQKYSVYIISFIQYHVSQYMHYYTIWDPHL